MLDKSGIFDKELIDLANNAKKMFEKKRDIANKMIDDLPESESKKKEELKILMKSATGKNVNHNDLLNKLIKIIHGG